MPGSAQLLPGTLDLLILKAVSLGPLHGYGILLRIGRGFQANVGKDAVIPVHVRRADLFAIDWDDALA